MAGEDRIEDFGADFSPEEQAAFDQMQAGNPAEVVDAGTGDGGQGAGGNTDQGTGAGADGTGIDAGGAGDGAAGAGAGAGKRAAATGADAGEGADDDDDGADGGTGAGAGAGAAGAGAAGERIPRRVSGVRFKEMSERATKAETDLAALRERFARGDERTKLLLEAINGGGKAGQQPGQEQQQDDDPEPDIDADIFKWAQWQQRNNKRMAETINNLRDGVQGHEDDRAAQAADRELTQTWEADAAQYAKTEPNFPHAYYHVLHSRLMEHALTTFGVNLRKGGRLNPRQEAQLKRIVGDEERALVQEAYKAGLSPADAIMELAYLRGWQPPAAGDGQGAGAAGGGAAGAGARGNGGAGAGAKPGNGGAGAGQGAGKVDVKAEIDRLKAGQEAAATLSLGGGSPGQSISLEKLADMSSEQFNELMDAQPELWERMIGGGGQQ